MQPLLLHEFHGQLGARFGTIGDAEAVLDYGDPSSEYRALRARAALLDLSFRSRLCLTGADRVRFLHGQVTNDIKRLKPGEGCYAALVNAKGRMESDLQAYCLNDEILLDFEPGYAQSVVQRLEKYVVADDVQVVDVAPLYGLLSLQGPKAEAALRNCGIFPVCPSGKYQHTKISDSQLGEIYLMNLPRLGTVGYDLFVPVEALPTVAQKMLAALGSVEGKVAGWEAFEGARIEAGIPRFGVDMDNSNFPQECGIEAEAVSYTKGCYIGQEVLNRIHTLGHVNRGLKRLKLAKALERSPGRGDKIFQGEKEVGYLTSVISRVDSKEHIALGIVRNEATAPGTELRVRTSAGESPAIIVELPFRKVQS